MLSWHVVDCTKCGQKAGNRCRSLTTNRVTDTHQARDDAYHALPARWAEPRSVIRRAINTAQATR